MSPIRTGLLVAACAFAGAAFTTPASAATEVFIDSMGVYNNAKIEISGPGFYKNPDADAQQIVFNYGVGPGEPTFTVWGFCVDIYRAISSGYYSQKPENLQYHLGDLTEDGHGNALSASQVQQIYGLAALGASLAKSGAADLQNKLSGIQGAIWAIEYPTFTIDGNTDALDAYIAGYVAQAPSLHGAAQVLIPDDGSTQSFVIGVPEPATWAIMILGFGLVGQALRQRRRQIA